MKTGNHPLFDRRSRRQRRSTTYTVNGRFGAVVIAPGTGFFLNDEMDDFTVKVGEKNLYGLVQGTANSIAPVSAHYRR